MPTLDTWQQWTPRAPPSGQGNARVVSAVQHARTHTLSHTSTNTMRHVTPNHHITTTSLAFQVAVEAYTPAHRCTTTCRQLACGVTRGSLHVHHQAVEATTCLPDLGEEGTTNATVTQNMRRSKRQSVTHHHFLARFFTAALENKRCRSCVRLAADPHSVTSGSTRARFKERALLSCSDELP
jgi:hypothetical protein